MASCITEQFGNTYCPQVRLTVTQTSSSNTSVTLTWVLEYVAHGFAFYIGSRSYSVIINGSTVGSGTFAASGITGTAEIARGTKTINKTTSAQNISFSMSFTFNGSWNGVYGGTKSASGSISVAAKPSYKITYNANGGSGAPSAQTKWYGVNLTLSRSKPSRTGYSFLGWSTSSTATTATYSAGATYTANVSDTLYAVWKANTYTVKFNANGGSGAPANQTKTYGKTLTLSSTKPTRTNYNFKGWGTSASSTTVAYAAGASYTKNEAITLYAIWELAYTPPRITDFSVDRCTSAGGLNEEGTYALVEFSWATDKTVSSIKIEYKLQSASTYSTQYVTASGISGAVRQVVGGSMDTEYLYNIRVTVSDSNGSSTSEKDVPAMAYIIDFLAGGKGVAFGKPAANEGLEVALDATFDRNLNFATSSQFLSGGSPFIKFQSTGRPTISNHIALGNGMWLQGALASGIMTNILRINESGKVELNWTSGGLRGRVSKQLWTGTWSQGGTITVPEAPYYNILLFTNTHRGNKILVTRKKGTTIGSDWYGFSAIPTGPGYGNIYLYAVLITVDNDTGTKLTLNNITRFQLYETETQKFEADMSIDSIEGIL